MLLKKAAKSQLRRGFELRRELKKLLCVEVSKSLDKGGILKGKGCEPSLHTLSAETEPRGERFLT